MALELLEYFGISVASAVVLIVLAKFILQHIIRKSPDYYDKRERMDEAAAVANFGKAEAHEHNEPESEPSTADESKPVEEAPAEPETEKIKEEPKPERKPAKKGRKPSMNMRKDELIAAAKERGIELPEKITKAQILELIKQSENKE